MTSLGSLGVGTLGIGCAGMSGPYGPRDRREAVATVRTALELGVVLVDTSDAYGPPLHAVGHNEQLVAEALEGRRDEVVLATKWGIRLTSEREVVVDGRPETARESCEASLRRLRTDVIDLYYLHRCDPEVPIEESVGAMAELVADGKVREIGLCEVTADTLRRAHAVHPVAALQSEWSLWTRDVEADVLPEARRLGAGVVAYSPLGRGFLTGSVREGGRLAAAGMRHDVRANMPRFQGDNLDRNLALLRAAEEVAGELGCTVGQLALAWLLARPGVVPIPGTARRDHLEENLGAAALRLDHDRLARLEALFPAGAASGHRYGRVTARGYGQTPATSR